MDISEQKQNEIILFENLLECINEKFSLNECGFFSINKKNEACFNFKINKSIDLDKLSLIIKEYYHCKGFSLHGEIILNGFYNLSIFKGKERYFLKIEPKSESYSDIYIYDYFYLDREENIRSN